MMKQLPADIKEAVDLLKAFERTEDYYAKPDLFREAIEILDLHLKDNPESPHLEYIGNVKRSYAKVFVRHLAKLPVEVMQDEYSAYTQAIDDIIRIFDRAEDAESIKKCHEFLEMWKEDMDDSMIIPRKNHQRREESEEGMDSFADERY